MEHDRECERCYIRKYTVRGDLLYSPFRPELLLELVKLVEFTDRETPPSSLEMASCLLMGFDFPDSVRSLASARGGAFCGSSLGACRKEGGDG